MTVAAFVRLAMIHIMLSDGTSANRIGGTTTFSDGRTCNQIGFTVTCY